MRDIQPEVIDKVYVSVSPFSQALSPDAKMLNRVAQGRVPFAEAVRWFESLQEPEQPGWLRTIAFMCHQSHPRAYEIDPAIALGGLNPTLTPCVMLRADVQPEYALDSIADLPAEERQNAFRLMFALYCIADTRRRQTQCKNGCSHEWHNFDSNQVAVEQTATRKPWRYLGLIAALTAGITPFAGAFWAPIGPASHVQLPGVLMFLALAAACCVTFMRCPSRPRWGKIAALMLSLPALYLAVDTAMMYLAFGWRR